MDNLEEMDRFLEKFNLARLNQEEIEIRDNPITSTEMETVIKNLSKNKSPGPDGFTGEFYQTFREELMYNLLKLFQKFFTGRNTSKHILQGHHQSDTKTRQRQHTKKENYRPISLMNIGANLAEFCNTSKSSYTMIKLVYSRDARILQYTHINQCDTPC